MTEATLAALDGLRDLTMLKWYVIPLLAIVFYIYAREIKEARRRGNWDAVLAGLTLFGMDFFNETWNGWVLAATGRSAVWTAPGDTALRTMVGWNIEIMFMFAIAGIVYYHTISDDPKERILGLNNRWFWAVGYAAFCVLVEVLLNVGGHLVWEYPFWNRSLGGIWLIFVFGYFEFYAAIILVLGLRKRSRQWALVAAIYAVPILMNLVARVGLGWNY
ncbi:MAG: hypothetical protein JXB39_09490 [Deltaproteobacteria bacterium]|nr:hypothetical protein [Deltaproteobacteria bacterium]